MKNWSKKAIALAAVAALGFGASSVMARGGGWGHGPCPGYGGPGPQGMMNDGPWERAQQDGDWVAARTARIQQYLAWLQPTLQLRADQMVAWERFSAFINEHVAQNAERRAEAWNNERPATAVERLEWREKNLQAMEESLAAMKSEVAQFYGQLDPQQQQAFNANFHMGAGAGAPMGRSHATRHGGWHRSGAGWGGQ